MTAIGATLATIEGLRVFDYPPDDVPVPAAIVAYPDKINYDETYGRGTDSTIFPTHILVGRVDQRAARDRLGPFVTGMGPKSVKAALVLDPTLGGVVGSANVNEARIVQMTVNRVEYLAATFQIEVFA